MTTNSATAATNEIAIVTGGSRGLGRSTALSLALRGVDVIFTYHAKKQDAETVVHVLLRFAMSDLLRLPIP